MTSTEINQKIVQSGVIAILRSHSTENFLKASEVLIENRITAIEVTLTTPGALQVLGELAREFQGEILLGIGSVLNEEQVKQSVDVGACYIITPVVRPQVIAYCQQNKISLCTGAYSPTEAQNAFEMGSDFIKIFPAETLGIKYIKGLLAPLPHLPLIPTGGVDQHNAADFIRAGCKAVGVGSSLVSQEILRNQDWKKLGELAQNFANNVANAQTK